MTGGHDFLIVEMPPGSAKSTYVNWLFPAAFLSRFAGSRVLTASHSSELAEYWGRRTRNLIAAESNVLDVGIIAENSAAHRWRTTNDSELYAVGAGVGIMGFRADLGLIDDPFGSREDAESKRIRDKIWQWYVNDFSSRLKPNAKRVLMHQRFHEDDLAGRVIAQLNALGKPYRRLKIRAEATDNDPLGRKPGQMLWDEPGGYDYGKFLRDRKAESDARTWSALYQQEPTPDTGDYFKREWLIPVTNVPARPELRVYGASDYAVTKAGGDYTVHIVCGVDHSNRLYVLDLWRGQTDSAEWIEAWCDLVLKWRPSEWAEEGGQINASIGPFLQRRALERKAYTYRRQFPSRHDKSVRAQSIRARMSMTGLHLPISSAWKTEFESELLRFPTAIHDDQVDALGLIGQLLDHMNAPIRPEKAAAPRPRRRDWFDEDADEDRNWKTA